MTWYVKGPVEAVASAAIVRVEVAVPPEGGVMGEGSVGVTPAAAAPSHEPESATAELKLLSEVTVHMLVPLPPCATVTGDGAQEMLKSGASAGAEATVMCAQFLALREGQSPQYPDASSQYSKWNPIVFPGARLKSCASSAELSGWLISK